MASTLQKPGYGPCLPLLLLLLLLLLPPFASCALDVFQAATPPRRDLSSPACRTTLFTHSFGNSYGAPYVGLYPPPPPSSSCPPRTTTTIFNLSIVSSGRQYDRLATLWLGDVEVWRTSTAMPRPGPGIAWSYQKDVSAFDALLRRRPLPEGGREQEQTKLIFDLGNVVDGDLYTGYFNVTLEALYFDDEYTGEGGFHPADAIYALSSRSSAQNTTSLFSLPSDDASVALALPRNARTAVVSLAASGSGAEEFWFTNVPSPYVATFPANAGWLYGHGAFREVQLSIDGQLAGVSWPFPVLFTGGVDPGAWRPIAGIDAFELPTFEIDVTPWLGLLADGREHSFALRVVGFDSAAEGGVGTVGENWWVSGSVFVWLDDDDADAVDHQTTAEGFSSQISGPAFDFRSVIGTTVAENGTVTNSSLYLALTANRSVTVSSTIRSGDGGPPRHVSWVQELSYSNIQNMSDLAFNQSLALVSSGRYAGSFSDVVSRYTYPLNLYSDYDVESEGATTSPGAVFCMVDRSKVTEGIPTLPFLTGISTGPETFRTRQNVTSDYKWNETIVEGSEGRDTMDGAVWLSYSGTPGRTAGVVQYHRYAREKNDTVIEDQTGWSVIDVPSTMPLPYLEGVPPV
ncbi:hypothetical protein F4778DRAFT_772133 [Xylariomycetidae sp. FL2044]|nr:hypothetical protein F4778DRAFT_772133 [Xylariomycetidae sp. FL2044]